MRERFVIKLTQMSAGHLHRNAEEILGPGDYTEVFIETFNDRSKDFRQCKYVNGSPGVFPAKSLRCTNSTALGK